ncbi:hypothetical protein HaLaN_32156 [Haematococcus lacustris]|uniref:Uncharacterized protein n=1 Tax=Haematococcus lacustris TaxID=44745 RepID=A0A6A0AM52_HAELA|nr:hypothetical protein HaLaN_32156 [Haematococcus lacustris]
MAELRDHAARGQGALRLVPFMKYLHTGMLRQGWKMATQAGPGLTVDRRQVAAAGARWGREQL